MSNDKLAQFIALCRENAGTYLLPGWDGHRVAQMLEAHEAETDAHETNKVLADNYIALTCSKEFEEALKVGDGTLHGAIDYWQTRALKAEEQLAEKQAGPAALPRSIDLPEDWRERAADSALALADPETWARARERTAPPSPLTEQDKEDAERYRYWRDEIPWAQAQAICAHKGKAADDAIDAHRAARAKKEQQ